MRKELLSPGEFEEAVREEISISSEFGLPLCALVISLPHGPDADLARRLLSGLRLADLATITAAGELFVVLPNTTREDARAVEERLRSVAPPGSAVRSAPGEIADSPESLLERARRGGAAPSSG